MAPQRRRSLTQINAVPTASVQHVESWRASAFAPPKRALKAARGTRRPEPVAQRCRRGGDRTRAGVRGGSACEGHTSARGADGHILERTARSITRVHLQDARWRPAERAAPSREAEACRRAFVALVAAAADLAAVRGNLVRLSFEYRRSVRRARALQDVLLPELDQAVYRVETRIEELEQEDAISMRHRA
jgi:hypothetical protein